MKKQMFYVGIRKIGKQEYYAAFSYDLYRKMGKVIIELLYQKTPQELQMLIRGIEGPIITGRIKTKLFQQGSDRRMIMPRNGTTTEVEYNELTTEERRQVQEIKGKLEEIITNPNNSFQE